MEESRKMVSYKVYIPDTFNQTIIPTRISCLARIPFSYINFVRIWIANNKNINSLVHWHPTKLIKSPPSLVNTKYFVKCMKRNKNKKNWNNFVILIRFLFNFFLLLFFMNEFDEKGIFLFDWQIDQVVLLDFVKN